MQLSVIIVSFNSRHVLEKCLGLLKIRLGESFAKGESEIIIVDNNSTNSEQTWLKSQKEIKLVCLNENVGFGRANNVGLKIAKGEYVLFLNSDVYLEKKIDFQELIDFLGEMKSAAGLTVKLLLPSGKIDPASHRGFPTPWNSLSYFSGLEKLTGKVPLLNRVFGGYHLLWKSLNTTHEIDSPTAAFFLLKKKIVDSARGFDPDYFFYGEDLDLSYRLKKLNYSLWYYPKYEALHLKYQSGQKSRDESVKFNARRHFYKTMGTFVDKHYREKYPWPVFLLIKGGISLMSKLKK